MVLLRLVPQCLLSAAAAAGQLAADAASDSAQCQALPLAAQSVVRGTTASLIQAGTLSRRTAAIPEFWEDEKPPLLDGGAGRSSGALLVEAGAVLAHGLTEAAAAPYAVLSRAPPTPQPSGSRRGQPRHRAHEAVLLLQSKYLAFLSRHQVSVHLLWLLVPVVLCAGLLLPFCGSPVSGGRGGHGSAGGRDSAGTLERSPQRRSTLPPPASTKGTVQKQRLPQKPVCGPDFSRLQVPTRSGLPEQPPAALSPVAQPQPQTLAAPLVVAGSESPAGGLAPSASVDEGTALTPRPKQRFGLAVPELGADSEPHFCPEPIVPGTCECILVVPLGPLHPDRGAMNATDANGDVVLRLMAQDTGQAASGDAASLLDPAPAFTRFVLQTAHGDHLADCRMVSRREFAFHRNTGAYYGMLAPGASRHQYVLVTRGGSELNFWGSADKQSMRVTDASGKLLAMTQRLDLDFETEGSYCRARLAPLVDVGLMVCGFLCVEAISQVAVGLALGE